MTQFELRDDNGKILATSRFMQRTALPILRDLARDEYNMQYGEGYITQIEDGAYIDKFDLYC